MNQEFASPVIQQPENLKKKFCFAAIPFLIVALLNLYEAIWSARNILSNIKNMMQHFFAPTELMRNFYYIFIFFAVVFITVLLFAKKNNFLLGIPTLIISAGYMMLTFSFIISSIFNYDGWRFLFNTAVTFFAALAFLVVSIYIFIVTSRKKPVSKALCIIPAILFSLFNAPFAISAIIELIGGFYPRLLIRNFTPIVLFFGVILLLIWVTSPYKKNKAEKSAPVMPKPVAAPVIPSVENKSVENGQTKPLFGTVDMSANTDEEVTVDPVMRQFISPVQPVSKPADDDPERTLDYSYAEKFYPPVSMPEEKPEIAPLPTENSDFKNEVDKQQTVMKLLTEYKKLLDNGVITQEDYDKKKNELLGL